MSAVRDLAALLRLRDFRSLLAARLLSQAADGVFQVALATFVVFSPEKQATPAAIAGAMAVLLLPYSLLGPFTGVLLDRWRRRQVLLHGNLLRAALTTLSATLVILPSVPLWLFYVAALSVTAVNRFVLAGLSAALPRVVDDARKLVVANSLTPTAGTLAATAGGGLAFVVRLLGPDADALVVLISAALYLTAALTALRMTPDLLGPDAAQLQVGLKAVLLETAHGLVDGLRHLARRRAPARALAAMTAVRFCYGALTVMVLMLCRYAWSTTAADGLALLGMTVAASGAGFFAAALVTPWAISRFTLFGWIACCAALGAVLVPALGLPFTLRPMLVAAFVLGLSTQGTKIATDTVVQATVDDAYRGRVFAVYDVLFNVAFVGAAAVAALMLPPDGRSVPLVIVIACLYAATVVAVTRSGFLKLRPSM
ncbi:MFS transporter [Streptomyces benahoarensis]|uniref:MFS transporter n=1 Tax=Streptomyces benahoarensis TaxID=2595054 RepID=A0A553ZRC8_9ACTN|nr:MFS transporter [Streptomyces benahoarensis]TSB32228.1 MFS transporter [Streptomyces benahoarensis]TSB44034.1 MFS transporter [Streptomyces benahoarensis]